MNTDPDLDDDLSGAVSTETLLGHDLVPDGLLVSSKGLLNSRYQIHHIGGTRYLMVDRTANRRHGSKVSKIWQYGMELRALDSPNPTNTGSTTSAYLQPKPTKLEAQWQ